MKSNDIFCLGIGCFGEGTVLLTSLSQSVSVLGSESSILTCLKCLPVSSLLKLARIRPGSNLSVTPLLAPFLQPENISVSLVSVASLVSATNSPTSLEIVARESRGLVSSSSSDLAPAHSRPVRMEAIGTLNFPLSLRLFCGFLVLLFFRSWYSSLWTVLR